MTQAIFLSYASQDADAARRICDALRAAGLTVWFDQSELRGGDAWDASIRKQIKECSLFVPIISANTNAREEGYFRLEWKLAVDRSHLMADNKAFFFPVILDDVKETTALVPDKFRERQWSRLNDDAEIAAFAARVGKLFSGRGSPGTNDPKPAPVLESSPSVLVTASKTDDGFWVAVLPFKHRGTSAELAALAEGLSEEVVTGLSRFSYLRVIARAATLQWTGDALDLRAAGHALGARYVLDGAVRQSGSALRVAVQLIDTESGANLWAETYNRSFTPDDIFALQDDLVPQIVSTVADAYGVLPRSMSSTLRGRTPAQLTPYEAVIRSFGHYERVNAVEHALVRDCLEHAVNRAPTHSDCLAALAMMYAHEYAFDLNTRPDPLQRALETATRAVENGPANHSAFNALAMIQHYRGEFQAARRAAERAMALNPMDASTNARMGLVLAYGGDWETGCAIIERTRHFNPQHADWYWAPLCFNAYRLRDYRGAITLARNIKRSDYYNLDALVVASYGQLDEQAAAASALRDLLASNPEFPARARGLLRARGLPNELVEHIIEGLRKGEMDIANEHAIPRPTSTLGSSAAINSDHASVSIAVLAFANRSASADDEYFSDGLADELLNVLARIKGLRVAARTSAFSFKGKQATVAEIGRALNVATVLEGSVRKSGNRARISVQLVKVDDGFQLWSETYDRTLDDIFAVQDDIVQSVVKELRTTLLGESPASQAVIAAEIAQATTTRSENPEAQRLILQTRFYREKRRSADITRAVALSQEAVALDPQYADAHACLADAWHALSIYGTDAAGNPANILAYTALARKSAEAALALDANLALPHITLSWIAAIVDRDRTAAMRAARLALALAPDDPEALRTLAHRLMEEGQFEESDALYTRAIALNPLWVQVRLNYSTLLLGAGQFDDAVRRVREAIAVDDSSWIAQWHLAIALNSAGDYAGSVEAAAREQELCGGHETAALFREQFATGGWQGYLEAVVSAPKNVLSSYRVALAQVELGRADDALATLEEMVDNFMQHAIWLKQDPCLAPLRGDPGFMALLKRAGFSE